MCPERGPPFGQADEADAGARRTRFTANTPRYTGNIASKQVSGSKREGEMWPWGSPFIADSKERSKNISIALGKKNVLSAEKKKNHP